MSQKLDRREFLKISSLVGASLFLPKYHLGLSQQSTALDKPNILIFVFDTLSANHMSINKYPRETMPNLAKFIENATVYHNHHASAPYTTPATASLFTGTHAWTHRAFQLGQNPDEKFKDANFFNEFKKDGYNLIAYTQNPMVEILFRDFKDVFNSYVPREELFLSTTPILARLAHNDFNTATQAQQRIFGSTTELSNSLVLGQILENWNSDETPEIKRNKKLFPRGLPGLQADEGHFVLEDAIDWINQQVSKMSQPLLGYFHLLPPHFPYNTRQEFVNRFTRDNFQPIQKPEHIFSNDWNFNELKEMRNHYDEFLLYADSEFHRMITLLETSGVLDNSWIIFTSDHGELFERGIWGHTNLSMHQPVINIPLIIKAPGQKSRIDIYDNTSAIDIFPTLMSISEQKIPDWVEGKVLPPFNNGAQENDPVFSFNPRKSVRTKTLDTGIITIRKEAYKLIYYFGFSDLAGQEMYELYNVEEDPEELNNLYSATNEIFISLFDELSAKIDSIKNIE